MYCLQNHLLHNKIGVRVGVAAISAHRGGKALAFIGEGGMIVNVYDAIGFSVGFQALVDVNDGLTGVLDFGSPHKRGAGCNGADDGNYAIGFG